MKMKYRKFYLLIPVFCFLSAATSSYCVYQFNPQYAQKALGSSYISEAFFVPDDNVKKLLLSLIDNERSSILLAQYRLTDIDLARALCAAQQRGVLIRCITDKTCVEEPYNKLADLKGHKIPIAVHQKSGLMHNKFYVFGSNVQRKPLLWTGSANGSRAGTMRNQENVVVTENRKLIKQFYNKFVTLWKEIRNSKKDLPVTQKQVFVLLLKKLCKK